MDTTPSSDAVLARQVESELRLLHEAVLLVAAGGAPRVLVAGLRVARAVLPEAQRLAAASGVRVVPLWSGDERQFDVRVERAEP